MRKLLILANCSLLALAACASQTDDPMMQGDDEEDPVVPILPYRDYVVDKITVPTTSPEAHSMGLDLDGDGEVDNKLGDVIATLKTMGVDANASLTTSIDHGDTILLARLGMTSFTNSAQATFQTYSGSDPSIAPCSTSTDTTCRHHLQGTASFTAAADPVGKPLVGSIDSGMFNGSSGELVVSLALEGAAPVDLVLQGSKAQLTSMTDTALGQMRLAGIVTSDDVNNKIVPAVRDNVMVSVMANCTALTAPPACGCATDSDGSKAIAMFDKAPSDCNISVEEVGGNDLVQLLLSPDIQNEKVHGISLGVTATAVSAAFTVP